MRTEEFNNCYNAIYGALLDTPIRYESSTQYFSVSKLEDIRDTFGIDLYLDCLETVKRDLNIHK